MRIKRNTKLIVFSATFLICLVSCTVAIARIITNDDFGRPEEEETAGPISSERIVRDIRNLMNDTKYVNVPIQAYIIPLEDAHLNEFLAEKDRRVKFVSNFTGSAATVIISETMAALWTDSRYHIQAEAQLDKNVWTLMKDGSDGVPNTSDWLIKILPSNSRVGVDPYLIRARQFATMAKRLQNNGHELVPIQQNLVDAVWRNKPVMKTKPLEAIEKQFSGRRISDKIDDVRRELRQLEAESLIVTALDDIAWLLNLRGFDIEMSATFFAYLILTQNETFLYIWDKHRINYSIDNHFYLEGLNVEIFEYNSILAGINNVVRKTSGLILLSEATEAIQSVVPPERRFIDESPIVMLKVIKNSIEIKGMRESHLRDGAALVRYIHWLDSNIDTQNITEISGAEQLLNFRTEQQHFRGISFPTISACGSNAAIVHYYPTPETDKKITRDEIYLIDSGGQYLDGTTDVTRTVHFGTPKNEEIDSFTRVLKGSISLATAIFPPRAPYSFFDAMARRPLWDVGKNYGHGTGHGIGAHLSVHETPPFIGISNQGPGMMKNMFTSNEPGYYEKNSYGIRIEDIIQVIDAPGKENFFNNNGALKFDSVTMVPIQKKLIDVKLLTPKEVEYVNEYHEKVRTLLDSKLKPYPDVVEWLKKETEPIKIETGDGCDDHTETATDTSSTSASTVTTTTTEATTKTSTMITVSMTEAATTESE